MALLQLGTYQGQAEWRTLAERMLTGIQSTAVQYPTAFSYWLCAGDAFFQPFQEVALLGDPHQPHLSDMIRHLWSRFRPHTLAAVSPYPPPSSAPALLHNRALVDEKPTAYICQNFTCKLPVTDPADFAQQLSADFQSNSIETGQ